DESQKGKAHHTTDPEISETSRDATIPSTNFIRTHDQTGQVFGTSSGCQYTKFPLESSREHL
ncbi:hypothetical protein PIB30_091427, partial [Stylosanthes scabra]|nr:hypothetical protein [Stylosanthes scabra]